MTKTTVECENFVTLLGAGDFQSEKIQEFLAVAPTLVAADGGAAIALEQNVVPDWVIGDFDSLPHSAEQQIPASRRIEIAEQDTTDFEKCLASIKAPLILAVGFTGARIDHQLAVFNTLVRYPEQRCIVIGAEDVIFAAPPKFKLDCPPGLRVSLFALREMRARSTGLKWPIDQVWFAGDGELGTSNEALGPVALEVNRPGMLVLLPRNALDLAIDALTRTR